MPKGEHDLLRWKSSRKADYIKKDTEVEDLVEFLNSIALVAGGGSIDLDNDDPAYVGVAVDYRSGNRPKGAIAISQHKHETRNSILNHADDLLRRWYLEHNEEFVTSVAENEGEEYDEAWEGNVWQLSPDALDEALQRLDTETLGQVLVQRDEP
jgi:hypothetical protein